jgi:hypothetical protein
MAEETKSSSPSSSGKSDKSGDAAGRGAGNLAPVQGSYEPPGDPDGTAGTREHLGSERPYEGVSPEPEPEQQ